MTLRIQPVAGGVRLHVRVQPRASRSEISGLHGEALKVRLTAPAVEGAANEALVGFLAATFGVSRNAVTIVAGAKSRSKVIELAGIDEVRLRQLLHP